LSIGIALGHKTTLGSNGQADPTRLLQAADEALYDAKSSGRNKICAA
jgi:PleD family two-component response regulator